MVIIQKEEKFSSIDNITKESFQSIFRKSKFISFIIDEAVKYLIKTCVKKYNLLDQQCFLDEKLKQIIKKLLHTVGSS